MLLENASAPLATVVRAMNREQVLSLIRAHLADELEIDPASVGETTRFRQDLEADSLDLYTLVQELEDSYGVHDLRRGGRPDPDRRPGGGLRALERRRDGRGAVGGREHGR